MKIKTKRQTTTREWVKLTVPRDATPLLTQATIERKVSEVVNKLNAVGAWCRVTYQNNHATVFGSNGQKVRVSVV